MAVRSLFCNLITLISCGACTQLRPQMLQDLFPLFFRQEKDEISLKRAEWLSLAKIEKKNRKESKKKKTDAQKMPRWSTQI